MPSSTTQQTPIPRDDKYDNSFSSQELSNSNPDLLDSTNNVTLSHSSSTSAAAAGHDNGSESDSQVLQRQRSSSISMRLRHGGGINSVDNFARSWQRAACFPEVMPHQSSFVLTGPDSHETSDSGRDTGGSNGHRMLPREQLSTTRPLPNVAVEEGDGGENDCEAYPGPSTRLLQRAEIPDVDATSSLSKSYGTSYGTISSRVSETTRRHAVQLHKERHSSGNRGQDPEREPLLVKQVQREDGTRENIIVGQSTVPQTVFNSVNVLIGVGLLSLPLGIKYAGWFFGLLILLFSAVATAYTAKILARCLDVDPSLVTYADLAYISFGRQARLLTSILFCLELTGACVALVVLFADSLDALIPGWGILQWKIVCGVLLVPLNFVPLRLLSVTSIMGILSCMSIVSIVFIDGLIKPTQPGSLREPAKTSLFPANWSTLPLSFGLIMSPWGGHGVFPNIYRDMRHPHKYGKSLWATYLFTYSLDCTMAVIGWLMFGDAVRDEITANILLTKGYPRGLSICIVTFIAIIPITKIPLSCRPLVSTVEVLCSLDSRTQLQPHYRGIGQTTRQAAKISVRVLVVLVIVTIAIIFPSFDRIMALMGSCLCFTICIILPLSFYLKIFGKEITPSERIVDWTLLLASSMMAIVGTVWAFLPKETISADRVILCKGA